MHPIIKEYIETDKPISDLFIKEGSNQPVELAWLLMYRQWNREKTFPDETYEKIDEAIEKGHPDEEVFLLFISTAIVFYCLKEMGEKCESIFRISCSINVANYHPAIQANYYNACSFYYLLSTKELTKRDEANLLSLSKMPKTCPRYPRFLLNVGQIFAFDGRLQILSKNDLEMIETFVEKNFISATCFLNNALFTVNMKLIDKYYLIIQNNFKEDVRFKNETFTIVASILQGDFEDKITSDHSFNICISYHRALKNRDLETAKNIFGKIDKGFARGTSFGIFYFVNFHHAFVTGWYEIIENILINREKQNEHYMLDFFLVRYFLIKKNQDLAKFYYARLITNCEKFQAMGRLKFEMQFAFELSAVAFLELTQPIQIVISEDASKTLVGALITPAVVSFGVHRIVGSSNAIIDTKNKIKKYADIQRPILVVGETGAGKEVVARAIHEESIHHNKPFLAINCGALTDTLLQSELFGYESGAFTGAVTAHKGIFEAAEEGVVFLDEFGEMSPKLQVSLLRVLENNEILRVGGTKIRQINCRMIAATNANIEELISKKLFREDLYHRLKQFSISMLPLRQRKEDIPELINYFLNQQNKLQLQTFSNELMRQFQEYHWPGNIRELKNEIDSIKVLCGYKPIIEANDIEISWLKNKLIIPAKNSKTFETTSFDTAKHKEELMHQRILKKKINLADDRKQQIMQLFHQYKKLTRVQIADGLEICLLTASKDLKRLCDEGVLIKRKPTLSPRSHYFEIKEKTNV